MEFGLKVIRGLTTLEYSGSGRALCGRLLFFSLPLEQSSRGGALPVLFVIFGISILYFPAKGLRE